MANAAVAYTNLADSATITASSFLTLAPPSRLQNRHVKRKWYGKNGTTEYLTIDHGSSVSIDTVMLAGLNLTAAGLTRIRISDTDTTGQTGEIYDSSSAAGRVDPNYGYLIILIGAAVSGRYMRIDLSDTGLTRIGAGRLFTGVRTAVGINYSPGAARAWVDPTIKVPGTWGQTFVDSRDKYRTMDVSFEWLTEAEKNGFVESIDLTHGESGDFLFVSDTASTNLGRDSIWGFIDGNTPVIQPYTTDVFSKAYRLRERL